MRGMTPPTMELPYMGGIDDEFYTSNTDLDAKHNVTAPNYGAKISILRVAQWENGQARSRRMYIK